MEIPKAEGWVASPLRNNIKIELNAPASEVWKVIANPANVFSNCCGVNNVESKMDDSGNCSEYSIFYESEDGGSDMVAHSTMVWYEPNQGWASLDNDPHPMGFEQSLLLITIEQKGEKTLLIWSMHYNIASEDVLRMFVGGLDETLNNEVSPLFIKKFGGRII